MRTALLLLLLIAIGTAPASAQLGLSLSGRAKQRVDLPAWRELTYDKIASHLGFDGNALWVGTSGGGVYRWDTTTGSYEKFTRVNDGLADNVVLDMAVDGSDVWVGTFYGLSHWDGSTWTLLDGSNSPLDDIVTAVAVDASGTLWVGTYASGLFQYDGNTWVNFNTANSGLSDNFVTSLVFDPAGNAWLGTWGDGVDRFDGTTWTNFNPGNSGLLSVFAYVKAVDPADGTVWIWCNDDDFDPQVGTNSYDGTTWTTYTTATSGINADYIHSVVVDDVGDVWFQGPSAISRLSGGHTWTTFSGVPSFLDTNFARGRSLAVRGDGTLYAGTAEGFARFDGRNFVGMATPELWDNDIPEVALGADGTLWMASRAGLHGYRNGVWQRYTSANSPLPSDDVRGVYAEPGGGVLVGTFGGAARRDAQGTWTVWTAATSGLPINMVEPVATAPDGVRWFGSGLFGSGTSRLDGGVWTQFTTSNSGLASNNVYDIEFDPATGDTWFATSKGASRFDGSTWQTIDTAQGLAHNVVNDIVLAGGDVWMATFGGLSVFSSGIVSSFTSADGLPEDITLSVAIDPRGWIWTGHNFQGLARFDGNAWVVFDRFDGLADNRVHSIVIDGDDTKWLGTGFGVGLHNQQGVPGN